MTELQTRKQVIATALRMNAIGINRGKSGNVSARWKKGCLITPSGLAYEETRVSDIVFIDGKGKYSGQRAPSSEWRFHHDIYLSRPDVGAVVHASARAEAPGVIRVAAVDRLILGEPSVIEQIESRNPELARRYQELQGQYRGWSDEIVRSVETQPPVIQPPSAAPPTAQPPNPYNLPPTQVPASNGGNGYDTAQRPIWPNQQ